MVDERVLRRRGLVAVAGFGVSVCAGVCAVLVGAGEAGACSVAMWADSGRSVVVGRNVDWVEPPRTDVWALPRGVERRGSVSGKALEWTSVYGSVVGVAYGGSVNSGMNERGLTANCLWLSAGDHGARDADVAGLSEAEWPQFYLDCFATVAEAVEFTRANPMQVRGSKLGPFVSRQHLALQDATGDSAVLEYVGGELKVYHDRRYAVVTNDPTYDLQIRNLEAHKGFGGEKPLPGGTAAADRFVRGMFYLSKLPRARTDQEMMAGIQSVMRNMAQPMARPDLLRPNVSMTVCTVVYDLTQREVHYETTTLPHAIWIEVERLDLGEGRPALVLEDVNRVERVGDVTGAMVEAGEMFVFAAGEG